MVLAAPEAKSPEVLMFRKYTVDELGNPQI